MNISLFKDNSSSLIPFVVFAVFTVVVVEVLVLSLAAHIGLILSFQKNPSITVKFIILLNIFWMEIRFIYQSSVI